MDSGKQNASKKNDTLRNIKAQKKGSVSSNNIGKVTIGS